MPFQMKFKSDDLKGVEPVPAGIYRVRFLEFKPKKSKAGTSVNLNAWVVIIDHPEWEKERKIVANLNTTPSISTFIQDFVHSFGLEMTDQLGSDPGIPGVFDGPDQNDPETWKYVGPLVNRTAEWELGAPAEGQRFNTIRKFICAVPQCASKFPNIQHSNDMAKKSS